MASDPNGWPDASKPGYPANPERDGWHWLMIGHGIAHPFPMLWCASGDMWEAGDDGYVDAADISTRWRYLGPCLTPAEVAAAVQAEREACADVAYHIYDDRMTCGEEETAQGAYDAAVSIQARGDTSALDAALAQARREGMEAAARIVESVSEWQGQDYYCDSCKGGAIYPDREDVAAAIRSAAGEVGK